MDHLGLRISPLCALCLFSSAFVSLIVRLCTSVSICIIVFRVEEILVGAVYRLLLCIAECGGQAPLQTLSRAPRPACHSAILTPNPGRNPRSLTHFQKLRRDLHLQEI